MISIVTAYFNRKQLFINTLRSIKHQNSKYLLEVIAVDDGSDENERLEDLISEFPFLKIIRLEKENKWYHNSCIPFNIGFKAAKGDLVIIQNPECFHYGNIIDFTAKNCKQNTYQSFGCFSLDKPATNDIIKIFEEKKIQEIIQLNDKVAYEEGCAGWYNHSIHKAKGYHFCAAITKKDLESIGGFDELYALGIAYDDDDLLSRIKKKKIEIQFVDNELVLHQNHYSSNAKSFANRQYKMNLTVRNKNLFEKISKKPYYKANIISRHLNLKLKKLYLKVVVNTLERIS